MTKDTVVGTLVLLAIIGIVFYMEATIPPASGTASNESEMAVRSFVQEFGSRLKNVSLLANDAGTQIAREYGNYVSPVLIAKWQETPENAPGRLTSSPWPDRIEIASVNLAEEDVFRVDGNIIELTRAENPNEIAGVQPITLRVEKAGDSFSITELEKGAYSELPQRTSVVGYWECLPHKNTTGPQTLECAFGIALDQSDGHLAVSTSLMSTYPVDFPTGTKVRIEGILTPINQLSTDMWQKYDIDGIINATTIEKIQ